MQRAVGNGAEKRKLLWKYSEGTSDLSDSNQGLYNQAENSSESTMEERVNPQSIGKGTKINPSEGGGSSIDHAQHSADTISALDGLGKGGGKKKIRGIQRTIVPSASSSRQSAGVPLSGGKGTDNNSILQGNLQEKSSEGADLQSTDSKKPSFSLSDVYHYDIVRAKRQRLESERKNASKSITEKQNTDKTLKNKYKNLSSNELSATLQKSNVLDNGTVDEIIRRCSSGEASLAEREEMASSTADPSKIGFAARIISSRIQGTDTEALFRQTEIEQEIQQYAESKGKWLTEDNISSNFKESYPEGTSARVYANRENGMVCKLVHVREEEQGETDIAKLIDGIFNYSDAINKGNETYDYKITKIESTKAANRKTTHLVKLPS